jgi:hypothetical protein
VCPTEAEAEVAPEIALSGCQRFKFRWYGGGVAR